MADWVNQFDVYLDCVGSNQPHGLPLGDREKNILLTSHLGREGFRTFSRTPEFLQRNDVPHQQYRRQVVDFFRSAPSRAKARYDFNRRDQQHGESVREYVTALRVLAQDCNWHDEDDAIATQLICGTADKKAQLEIFAIRDQPNLEAIPSPGCKLPRQRQGTREDYGDPRWTRPKSSASDNSRRRSRMDRNVTDAVAEGIGQGIPPAWPLGGRADDVAD